MEQNQESFDVLILQYAEPLTTELADQLHHQGFGTRIVTEIERLNQTLPELINPILVIDCGRNEDDALECIRRLIKSKGLHPFPLITIGKDVDSLEETIEKFFPLCLSVCTPFSSDDLYKALQFVTKHYPLIEQPDDKPQKKKEGHRPSPKTTTERRSSDDYESVPELLFDQLNNIKLDRDNLNLKLLLKTIDLDVLQQEGVIPGNERIRTEIRSIYSQAKRWSQSHLCRTAFVNAQFTKALPVSDQNIEEAKAASFLYAWSFYANNPDLLRKNYLKDDPKIRKQLARSFEKSAKLIANNLREHNVASIVSAMAQLIQNQELPANSDASLLGSSLIAADLLDRLCFQSGVWDAKAAYFLMRKAKGGELKALHPTALACMLQFMFETVIQLPPLFILPAEIRDDAKLKALAEETRNYEPLPDERRVDLYELKPGMRLSKPLMTFDGHQILPADVVLDEDLIWRVWQVCAIRPVNAPIIITE